MPVKKEICRNFARGSCHFGQRCRFLHQVNSSNSNSNNASLFQQPKSHQTNPYGFGVQNSAQPQPKAFDNTWTRVSSKPNSNSNSTAAPENHKCTDPETCRRIMADDFQNERPLWKLTCYGHWKGTPCDVAGDVSFEELRAAAYDDAARGLAFHSIVDRERNLQNSKLIEFDNLRKFGRTPKANNPFPQPVSSFNQPASSFTQPVSIFNQPVSSFNQPASSFNQQPVSSFNQQPASSFTQVGLNNAGFGIRFPAPVNNVASGTESAASMRREEAVGETTSHTNAKVEAVWLKHRWSPGEVPEEAPPDSVCT